MKEARSYYESALFQHYSQCAFILQSVDVVRPTNRLTLWRLIRNTSEAIEYQSYLQNDIGDSRPASQSSQNGLYDQTICAFVEFNYSRGGCEVISFQK